MAAYLSGDEYTGKDRYSSEDTDGSLQHSQEDMNEFRKSFESCKKLYNKMLKREILPRFPHPNWRTSPYVHLTPDYGVDLHRPAVRAFLNMNKPITHAMAAQLADDIHMAYPTSSALVSPLIIMRVHSLLFTYDNVATEPDSDEEEEEDKDEVMMGVRPAYPDTAPRAAPPSHDSDGDEVPLPLPGGAPMPAEPSSSSRPTTTTTTAAAGQGMPKAGDVPDEDEYEWPPAGGGFGTALAPAVNPVQGRKVGDGLRFNSLRQLMLFLDRCEGRLRIKEPLTLDRAPAVRQVKNVIAQHHHRSPLPPHQQFSLDGSPLDTRTPKQAWDDFLLDIQAHAIMVNSCQTKIRDLVTQMQQTTTQKPSILTAPGIQRIVDHELPSMKEAALTAIRRYDRLKTAFANARRYETWAQFAQDPGNVKRVMGTAILSTCRD